ncbi:MAG TPA: hypothetical protein VG842_04030 [Sediminibacterium sp.]|nr:hypothetical protein [Sediminibacterium sp.]
MKSYSDKAERNTVAAGRISQIAGNGVTAQLVDNRPEIQQQRGWQVMANSSPQAMQLKALQAMAASDVAQFVRTVTNSQKRNMQDSLVRMFGGQRTDYEIDQDSGSTFNDNNGKDTTGHHGVKVKDIRDGKTYTCDFHNNGKYYTRG